MKTHLWKLMALVFLLVAGAQAHADLLFELTQASQSGTPGSEVFFSGTLTNTGSSALFLNGIQFNFDSLGNAVLSGDDSVFFTNVPPSLAASGNPSASYTGSIFGVNIAGNAPTGTYTGTVTITGGADSSTNSPLAAQNIQIRVTPTPEAGTLFTLTLGFVFLTGAALRWRSDHKTSPNNQNLTLP